MDGFSDRSSILLISTNKNSHAKGVAILIGEGSDIVLCELPQAAIMPKRVHVANISIAW